MMKTRTLSIAGSVAALFAAAFALTVGVAADHSSPDDLHKAAASATGACAEGVVSRLYLGQATAHGFVTDAQWRAFVADVVTPHFPDGFTELQGHGRWRDGRGTLIEEQTRIVEVVHDGSRAKLGQVTAVATDYRVRFAQQSVLVTQARAFHCFESGD